MKRRDSYSFPFALSRLPLKVAKPLTRPPKTPVTRITINGLPTPNISAIRDDKIPSFAKCVYKAWPPHTTNRARKPQPKEGHPLCLNRYPNKTPGNAMLHQGKKRFSRKAVIAISSTSIMRLSISFKS